MQRVAPAFREPARSPGAIGAPVPGLAATYRSFVTPQSGPFAGQILIGAEIDHEFTERTTFVVTPDGKIAATLSTADDKISPAEHVTQSLAAVQKLAGGKASK